MIVTRYLTDLRQIMRFRRLRQTLKAGDLTPEARQNLVDRRVEMILSSLSLQPLEDQQAIRATLCRLGLLPERRCGKDRRVGPPASREIVERRQRQEQRMERDLSRWLGSEDEV
jgi:hypothetical protein